ncbi:Oxygen-independent coproporphyrinogen-III oxidase 1 [Sedimentisphaera cyanobacteriorum]|uniref:Oxygen-independent coproporphyrinogen-III oxidase 1 n=1 Tax=Sedimentisphaera cyanobacteriorum TaxID=1940790 RepID=A0A1Q2HQX0_9BACT|nr:radical SAM protein [Sedimentisphaera cyanobacteriorum]AQQ09859.1 Oxygen-independent coproporphyrinogen-III oxidase 1 [Sedimentisphaera cyanobacteriorum]
MNAKTETINFSNSNGQKQYQTEKPCEFPFDSRFRSHMDTYGWSRVSPTGNEKEYRLNIIKNGSSEMNRRTAYIHIPFCGTLCTFCNFMRKPGTAAMAADYAQLVIQELQWYKGSGYISQGGFEALYLGGGTPSLLPAEAMSELLNTARKTLGLDETAEITIESTVHDLTQEKLDAMVQSGVTRISLGVQTFNSDMRRQLGRLSDKETIYSTIEMARKAGIKTISSDILYRLPGQNLQEFQADLECAVELNLDGVSLYPLIAMGGTPLEKRLKEGKIPPLPDISIELEQCKATKKFLIDAGYQQDTCTHFVKPTDRNLYANIRLDDGDCLPIGSSAGGYLGPLVLMNAMDKQMYQMQISGGKSGYMASVLLPSKSRMLRSVTGQLQRGFLNVETVWQDGTLEPKTLLQDKIDQYLENGLLEKDGQQYRLTDDGWCWCYNIAADFADMGKNESAASSSVMSFAQTSGKKPHPHALKYGSKKQGHSMRGFSLKDISVLGVMTALVVVVQFIAAMVLHMTGIALIPGLMQFVMAFASCIILFVAIKKVPKAGALSIMTAVYSLVTMLLSGSILMGFGLVIGGVLGDLTAKWLGGIGKTVPLIIALVIYRTSQTTFSKLYAFITEMTQVQFVWYLVVLSIIASAIGAIVGGLAGIKLTAKISKAGVMA